MAIIHTHVKRPRLTIEEAVDRFIDYQSARAPGIAVGEYEELLKKLKAALNAHGANSLTPEERAVHAGQRKKSFCEIFGPEKLVEELERMMKPLRFADSLSERRSQALMSDVHRRLLIWMRREGGNC